MRMYCKYCYATHNEWLPADCAETKELSFWDCERCSHTSAKSKKSAYKIVAEVVRKSGLYGTGRYSKEAIDKLLDDSNE